MSTQEEKLKRLDNFIDELNDDSWVYEAHRELDKNIGQYHKKDNKMKKYVGRETLVALAEGKKLSRFWFSNLNIDYIVMYDNGEIYDNHGKPFSNIGLVSVYYEYQPPKVKYLKLLEELLEEGFVISSSASCDGMIFIEDKYRLKDSGYYPISKLNELGKPTQIEGLAEFMYKYEEK